MPSFILTPTGVIVGSGKDTAEYGWKASMKCGEWSVELRSMAKNAGRSMIQKPTCIYYVPLLKSALQKAIRRGLVTETCAIAYQLLRQDPIEFLRRLPIYMLEDTYLQPKMLIRCVWLMCACGKGWRLCEDDIRFLLGVIRVLSTLKYRELLDMDSGGDGLEKRLEELMGALSPLEGSVVCMWIRSEFGGLRGDICFLRNLALDWLDREKDGWELEENDVVMWEGEFPSGDGLYLFEGVDFHCYPGLLKEIGWDLRTMTNDEFRKAMWHGQSCVNIRKWLFEDHETVEADKNAKRLMLQYGPIMKEMRADLERFAKKAWIAKAPEKSIEMYFAKKL